MLAKDKKKPVINPVGLRRLKPNQRSARYLQVRWHAEFGTWLSKRRLRRQLARFRSSN